MATEARRAHMARSATLPILALSGLVIGCGDVSAPDHLTAAGAGQNVNSCTPPATVSPPTGATHPILGATQVSLGGTPFAVAISPAGVTYVTQLSAATASRADLPSSRFSPPFPVGEIPSQVRMSPDGKTAYVGDQDARTITYVDVATNQAFATATVPAGSILTVGVSPEGKQLSSPTDLHAVYTSNATSPRV